MAWARLLRSAATVIPERPRSLQRTRDCSPRARELMREPMFWDCVTTDALIYLYLHLFFDTEAGSRRMPQLISP